MFVAMHDGVIKGFMCVGQNPAGSAQHSIYVREALGKLDWLVVRDLYETETATFWKDSPEVTSGKIKPQDIQTEVILLPAAGVAETDGSFRCRNHDDEQDKNLAVHFAERLAEGHESEIDGVEHQLDGHEDGDDVAFENEGDGAQSKKNCAQDQIILRGDHAISSPAGRGRARP